MSEQSPVEQLNAGVPAQSAVENAAPKKGFRNGKKPTKKEVAQENSQLRKAIEGLQRTDQFIGQQVFNISRGLQNMTAEFQALAGLIRLKKSAGPVKEGDQVMIDTVGQLINEDGTPGDTFEGSFLTNTLLKVGEGRFIPGFEDQLVGLNEGDVKEMHVTFPENYSEDLKGKKAMFTTMVVAIFAKGAKDSTISDLNASLVKAAAEAKAKVEAEKAAAAPEEVVLQEPQAESCDDCEGCESACNEKEIK